MKQLLLMKLTEILVIAFGKEDFVNFKSRIHSCTIVNIFKWHHLGIAT